MGSVPRDRTPRGRRMAGRRRHVACQQGANSDNAARGIAGRSPVVPSWACQLSPHPTLHSE
eukprot:scaffold245625_cov33-Tisochrysis_lutea.AAC.2